MKNNLTFFILIVFTLCACEQQNAEVHEPLPEMVNSELLEIPKTTLDLSKLDYNAQNSLWTKEGVEYSGYAVKYNQDSILIRRFGILDGKKQNEDIRWYTDGHIKQSANYHKGKLHGEKKTWTPDSTHLVVSHLNYVTGKLHGTQKKWYPTGEIFKVLNLDKGKEEGIQKAFRKNGNLFANYEAREGRIFGLKRAALCFGLEEEKIQHGK